nr:sarcosine dehydrogenase, mitochondrial-like isoform X1 [Ciona intestinalis]|eukprot:XP_009857807.1 sarcosine dehydrogenase, mitochondrial-like isoform X1 [Ciona intestinalis]
MSLVWRLQPVFSLQKKFLTSLKLKNAPNRLSSHQSVKNDVPYESSIHRSKNKNSMKNKIPTEADVVVIGAGSVGCSTAYHLSKLGAGKVVMLEKSQITSGTTWHTAGILWSFRHSESETIMQLQTRDLISKILPEETGEDAGWLETGTLNTARTKDQFIDYLQHSAFAKAMGVEILQLQLNEVNDIHPLLNTSDLYGVIYSPACGTMDPATYCMSYVKAAAKHGLEMIENCTVNGITMKEDYLGLKRVQSVETNHGTIRTNNVVNCAGAWAPYIAQTINENVPQLVYKHAYVVTEAIEGILNTPMIKDHGSIYLKPQGNALQFGGYETNPILVKNLPKDFSFGLYDMDWDIFSVHTNAAINRIPSVETTGIRSTVCGPESFTPDGQPNMGESTQVRGYFHGSGFNSGGMMLGGGAGRQLAHWVIHGKPEIDLVNCDIRRHPVNLSNPNKWLLEKSHEKFAKRFNIHYPHDQSLGGRNQRKGRLYQEHADAGALFGDKFGFERPAYFVKDKDGRPQSDLHLLEYDFYGAYNNKLHDPHNYYDEVLKDCTFDFPEKSHRLINDECMKCRNSVAVFDLSYMAKLYIGGKDADQTVAKLLTRDITKTNNRFVYSLMLNKDAGVECDVLATKMTTKSGETEYYITAPTSAAQHCLAHIQRLIQNEKLHSTVEDRTEDTSIISVQGPMSGHVVYELTKDAALESLKYSEWKSTKVGDHAIMLGRLSFVGEFGFEIHCSSDHVNQIFAQVMEEVHKHNGCMAGYRAMESLSTEAGFHHWPHSINANVNPMEARLTQFCSPTTKYLGGKALESLKSSPRQKLLAYFTVDSNVPVLGHEIIWRNNEIVGFLRAADYGYSLGTNIGYGYVKIPSVNDEIIKSGNYQIEIMGKMYPAQASINTPYLPYLSKMFEMKKFT